MKNFLLIITLLTVSVSSRAQNIYSCTDGEITFFSDAPIEDIEATSRSMNSVLNTTNNEILFIVPMTSFKFKEEMFQEKFNKKEEEFNEKYVESSKYPNATYKGKINETIDYTKDGEYNVTSTGSLILHGVEKALTNKGKLKIKEGQISLESEFHISLKDYNIQIPQLLTQNIAETVKVNLKSNYQPFNSQK